MCENMQNQTFCEIIFSFLFFLHVWIQNKEKVVGEFFHIFHETFSFFRVLDQMEKKKHGSIFFVCWVDLSFPQENHFSFKHKRRK